MPVPLRIAAFAILAGCASLPPPTPENNLVACRDLARIESNDNYSLTDRYNAQIISRQMRCPRFFGSQIP